MKKWTEEEKGAENHQKDNYARENPRNRKKNRESKSEKRDKSRDERKRWSRARTPRNGEKQDAFGLGDGCRPCLRPLLRRRKCRRGIGRQVGITFLRPCGVTRRSGPRGAVSKETAANLSHPTTSSTLPFSLSLFFTVSLFPFLTTTCLQMCTCRR